mgnify:FL=1
MCIQFLLKQSGFYYVLTRSFSSDAVEATFSHIRLKGGSNDTTDARAAEYALRQILRSGILKSSLFANTASTVSHVSLNQLSHQRNQTAEDQLEELLLPADLRYKIDSLKRNQVPESNLYSASIAFLAGYVILKLQQKIRCDNCIAPLVSSTIPGPLLKLITLQDHGGLIHPSELFVGLVKQIADVIQEILPHLSFNKTCDHLIKLLQPKLLKNPLLPCVEHQQDLSVIIILTVAKPVLSNICLEKTDSLKRKIIDNKPQSRKLLKL